MKKYGPISTPAKDCSVPKPNAGSADDASFGKHLPDGPAPTKGEMKEVQVSDIGPKAGTKPSTLKIPGGGTY